jgi:C4-type Zn-finger protein
MISSEALAFPQYTCPVCRGAIAYYTGAYERHYNGGTVYSYLLIYQCSACGARIDVPSTPETDPLYSGRQHERSVVPPPFPGRYQG